jgi:hypothetical protein
MPSNVGIWGFGSIFMPKTILPAMGSFLKGWHSFFKWSEIEPTPGVFNFAGMDTEFKKIITDNGFDMGLMVWTGEFAPDWLYQFPFFVPKLKVSNPVASSEFGGLTKYFPYYYNDYYQQRFTEMTNAVIEHLGLQDEFILAKIKYYQSAEGTTGDDGPYHGTVEEVTIGGVVQPNPADYEVINDNRWDTYKKTIWANINTRLNIHADTCEVMINPSNDGTNFTYVQDTYPDAFLKFGDYSHNFAFLGNDYYSEYIQLRARPDRITRGELNIENVMIKWNNLNASPQALFAMIAHALNAKVTCLNLPLSSYNYLKTPDNLTYDFFNEFASPTTPVDVVRRGFAYLRRQVSISDIELYPETIYGPLIDPALQKGYDRIVNTINADPTTNEWKKLYKITNQRIVRANPERKQLLSVAFAQYGFQFGIISTRDDDNFSTDFGMDVIEGNYKRYINHINPYSTTFPRVRIGDPAINQLGRYGLYTTTETFFETTTEGLTPQGNNHVTMSVYYWNEEIGTIRLFYFNGRRKTLIGTITTTNSQQFLTATFLITDYKGGRNLPNQADFSVKKISGKNVTISLIKISALSLPPTGEERDCGEEPCEEPIPEHPCECKCVCCKH